MREGVVLKLPLGNFQIIHVGITLSLVSVELMVRFLLIVLSPSTVRGVNATVYTAGVTTDSRHCATLLQSTLTNIHATRVTHAVGLATLIFGAVTVLHELLVILHVHLSSGAVRIGTLEVGDSRCRLVVMYELRAVIVTLETCGVLGNSRGRDDTLRAVESQIIPTITSLGAVCRLLRPFVFITGNNTRHTLSSSGHCGKTRR